MNEILTEKSDSLPKISIGIVVYNGIEHIRNALESVIRQPYKNLELIVVDGGSADGTQDALKEYAERIYALVSERDQGIYDAMNKVCSLATGDWLLFLGCDDVLLDKLGEVAAMLKRPDTVYYGDVIKRSSGKIYGGRFSKYRLMRYNICHQSLFYPKSVYTRYSYNLEYRWLADYAYNLKLIGDKVPFVHMGVVVSIYNDKGGSAPGDADLSRDQLRLIREAFGDTYALIEVLCRLRDKVANLVSRMLRRLLPHSYWKYCQTLWRRLTGQG
ncbi:MAG TPA: glycosyltransferase family 2 protein [Gallionella sp.]|nr:glycosyltransferase family 2 protein [Gallionella sp.]